MSFQTARGTPLPTCSYRDWCDLTFNEIGNDGLSELQVVEGVGFSFAMVVRFALGLSSNGGVCSVIPSDSFFGWMTLCCARHLLNSGCTVRLLLPDGLSYSHPVTTHLLSPLEKRGADLRRWQGTSDASFETLIEGSHNVLCGFADAPSAAESQRLTITNVMNESPIPVHSVGVPLGMDVQSGELKHSHLYSSSTLSIALPMANLLANPDLLGRHYVADGGWSIETYRRLGYSGEPLFSEQPVIQITCSE